MKISIIIPTLNEEDALPNTLRNIARCAPQCEVIVVDGGSSDRTRQIAKSAREGAILWIDAPRGRGNQMNAGALKASGDVLLFLHADTHLPSCAPALIESALADGAAIGGFFRIAFAPSSRLTDFFAWCYNLRSHLRIFYGDAALFVRRETFEQLGGYEAGLIMEDVEFVRRLRRRGAIAYVTAACVSTSARRFPSTWKAIGMLAVWSSLQFLMHCGVSQETLARLYPAKR